MNSWALTDKGIVRKQNQDVFYSFCDDEKSIALLCVCDGMGGAKAGNVASAMAAEIFVEEMKKHMEASYSAGKMKRIVAEAVKLANREVFEKSVLNYDYDGMGTTLVAAVMKGDSCIIANVGDSRAYKITRLGINQITRDHSVIEDMITRGEVTRENARRHPQKNLITRAIGTAFNVECDVFTPEIKKGDYILLCSDGLTNVVSEQEIMYEVLNNQSLEDSCQRMLSIALMRGAPDNLTMVLFIK